jgi:predicted GNAT family acetyltransferase
LVDGVMRNHHTEVPLPVSNRGVAAQLVRAAFEYAAAHDLKVEPRCSYVRSYMRRHPETLRLLPANSPLRH